MKIKFKSLLLFVSLVQGLISVPTESKSQDFLVPEITQLEVGSNNITGNPVNAKRYTFERAVTFVHVDTVRNFMSLHLRKKLKRENTYRLKGHLLQFDLNKDKIEWYKEIDFGKNYIQYHDNVIVRKRPYKLIGTDLYSGELLWERKNDLVFVFPEQDVGIGYNMKRLKDAGIDLQGFNLNSGELLWERKIPSKRGWREFLRLDDNTALISASGLHAVNQATGEGWSHEETVGKNKFNFIWGNNNVYNVCSNILVDSVDQHLYFASSTNISLYDYEGNIIWSQPLNNDESSKSGLIEKDNSIILVSLGMTNSTPAGNIRYGKASVAKYNKKDGTMLYRTELDYPKDYIRSAKMVNAHLFLLYAERMILFDTSDGKVIKEGNPGNDIDKTFRFAYDDRVYLKTRENEVFSLPKLDSTLAYFKTSKDLKTSKEFVVGVDKNLTCKQIHDGDNIFIPILNHNSHTFVSNNKQILIFDQHDNLISTISGGFNVKVLGDNLYSLNNNYIDVISLQELLVSSSN
ncbi:MAG: PQQ-binding-like beta-propeller repeat protein [Bacteroidia bacterium]|nr:PQQ-binding-like beta-propeller repeat protein [Bacteroidia bacterium]